MRKNPWWLPALLLFLPCAPAWAAPPVIRSALTASGNVASAFSYQISATRSPTSYGASGLPAGLGVNTANGLISGTPSAVGTSDVLISATNADGTGTATLTVTIRMAVPVITSALAVSAQVDAAFSYRITATNAPTSFDAANLPEGLGVDRISGVISGTPRKAGTRSVVLSAANAGGTGTAAAAFSVVAVLPKAAAPDLGRARAYPVPYKPAGGNPAEGKPYSPGDPASGIIFDNLPADVAVKIYTLDGRLAAQFGTSAGTGSIRWDARNEAGRDAASGGYFAIISSPGQKSVVRRLLIVR